MKTINFNGTILEYKSTHRSLVEYEKLSGKDEIKTYTDSIMLMFCIVKSQAKAAGIKFELDFDQFVDWLDANEDKLNGFTLEEESSASPEATADNEKKS